MFRCPHCHTELKPETLAAGAGTVCPDCGVEVDLEFEDFNLSSLGGSPADLTAKPVSDSSLGGSSFALSALPDSELESERPSSGDLLDETLEASSGKLPSDAAEAQRQEPEVEATLAFGGRQDDDDLPLMLGDDSDEDDYSDLDARNPGESLNATVDFGHFARFDREPADHLAGPASDATMALGGKFAAEGPPSVEPPTAPDLTQMVGFPIRLPGVRSSSPSDATLPADSDRAGSGVSDSSLGRSSVLPGRDSSGRGGAGREGAGDKTESPSTHAEGHSRDRDSATLAFDSERRSERQPTPEPIDITGLSTGNTIPRGPLEAGRGVTQLGPGDSQVVGDESVRLRAFYLGNPASDDPATMDYAIEGEAGKGGMGVVYKARQQSLNRLVAIKQIKTDLGASASDLNKFISEAVITGQLEHPNIAPVHDLGLAADGLPFYAMKFVEGRDWEDSIKDLSEEENLAILIQVAQAIAFAHSRNVLHRDLKPGNVRLGAFGEVLVMDWGLAARLDDGSEIQPAGTPIYMPPETALEYLDYAKGRVVGRRVDSSRRRVAAGKYGDVYLLGALLFKIVTGRAPHRGKSTFECLRAAAKNEIVKVRRTSELLDIAYKAMASDPEHRHDSALEFIDAIRAYQSHAQSIKIARRASQELREAEALRGQKDAKATDLYASYSRAQHGYQNALELWRDNKKASRRLKRTLRNFAEAAYGNGDYDLALSLLDDTSADDAEMRVSVLKDQKSRKGRLAWFKTLQYAVAGSLALALCFIAASIYLGMDAFQARGEAAQARNDATRTIAEAESQAAAKINEANQQAEAKVAAGQAEADTRVAQAERLASEREAKADQSVAKANDKVLAAEDLVVAANEQVQQAESAAKEQGFYAAVGSISAALSDNGAYAASKLLIDQEAKLTNDQRADPLWINLRRSADWRDEASELVSEVGANGPTLVAALPDGSTLVTASAGKLSVYREGADKPSAVIPFKGAASQLAIDSTGRHVAVVAQGVTLIDLASSRASALDGLKTVTRVAFAPRGGAMLVGDDQGRVELWQLSQAGASRTQSFDTFNDGAITALGFSGNGKQRFSADRSGRIVVWRQGASGSIDEKETYSHEAATGTRSPVVAVAMTDEAPGRLAYGCEDGSVYELAGWWPTDASDGTPLTVDGEEKTRPTPADRLPSGYLAAKPTRLRASHPAAVTAVAYADADRMVLSSGSDTILVQSSPLKSRATDAAIKDERRYHDKTVLSLALAGGQRAVSSDEMGRVVVWDILAPPDQVTVDTPEGAPVATIRFTDDAKGHSALAVADQRGFVHRWDDVARPVRLVSQHAGHADHRDFQAWRLEGDRLRMVTVAPEERTVVVDAAAAKPTSRRIAIARACVWDGETGVLLRTLDLGERTIVACDTQRGVLYASAEGRLIDPDDQRAVAIAQPLDGSPATPLWTDRTRVSQLCLLDEAAGGATLAVGMRDGQVFLWSPTAGRIDIVPSSVRPHWTPVRSLAFDAATGRMASGDNEGRVALWSLAQRRVLAKSRLKADASRGVAPVVRMSLAADGAVLAVQRTAAGAARAHLLDSALQAQSAPLAVLDADLSTDGSVLTLLKAQADHGAVVEQVSLRSPTFAPPLTLDEPAKRLATSAAGWLVWGEGFAEWRPSDGGQYRVASRVVSRPTPIAILAGAPGEGMTSLSSIGSIDRWDAAGQLVEQTQLKGGGPVLAATRVGDGSGWLLARHNAEGGVAVELWTAQLEERRRVVMQLPETQRVALAEAKGVAIAAVDQEVRVSRIDADAATQSVALPDRLTAPFTIAAHPTGKGFVVAGADGLAAIGEQRDGKWQTHRLDRQDITSVAYAPAGDRLLAGIASGRVLLLELSEGAPGGVASRPLLTFSGHSSRVTHLGLAGPADAPSLVSGDASGRVLVRPL